MTTIECVMLQEDFDKLRSFVNGGGRAPGDINIFTIDPIPGVSQPGLRIIRYIYDTKKVDDYGKPIMGKRFIVDHMLDSEGAERIISYFPHDMDKCVSLTGNNVKYKFIPIKSIEQYFIDRYRDEIKMKLISLLGFDKEHKDDYEVMMSMIKEIE